MKEIIEKIKQQLADVDTDCEYGNVAILAKDEALEILSHIESTNYNAVKTYFDLTEYLERINAILWESLHLKNREFGKDEGYKIADILEEWANKS